MLLSLTACQVDLGAHEVLRGGERLRLTKIEAALLAYLAERSGVVVPREALLRDVWGYRPGVESRAVDHTMARLRGKVEADPAEPAHLRSVYGVGYRFDAAPPELPIPGPTLHGREVLEAQIRAALAEGPLLLWGPAGVGKTALARRVANDPSLPAPRWFVSLAGAHDVEEALLLIAAALGVEVRDDPAPAIRASLRGGTLVLDEADRFFADTAALLNRLGSTRALVTARGAAPGVRSLAVPPLDPAAASAVYADTAGPGFDPTAHPELPPLLAALEGSPLAIRLAASRFPVLPPAALLARLDRRLDLLRDGEDGLRAALAWSWDLLSDPERTLACTLVAVESVTLEAIEAVAGAAGLEPLQGLVRRSFAFEASPGRFTLYSAVRAFAAERTHTDAAPAWLAWLLLEGERALTRRHTPAGLRWLLAERANLERALAGARPEDHARLLLILDPVWAMRGPVEGHRRRLAAALPTAGELARPLAAALAAVLIRNGASAEALRVLEGREGFAVELARARAARQLGRVELAGATLDALRPATPLERAELALERASWLRFQGRLRQAEEAALDAVEAAQAAEAPLLEARARLALAQALTGRAEHDEARVHLTHALTTLSPLESWRDTAEAHAIEGIGWLQEARWDDADRAFTAAADAWRALGRDTPGVLRSHQASVATGRGDLAAAESLYLQALAAHREARAPQSVGVTLGNLGWLDRLRGQTERAGRRLAEAVATLHDAEARRMEAVFRALLAVVRAEAGDLAAARAELAEARSGQGDRFSTGIVGLADAWLARRTGAPDAAERARAAIADAPSGPLAEALVAELRG